MNRICDVCNKICYTERQAGMILNSLRKHHISYVNGDKEPKRKYWCEYCRLYHLTSMSFYDVA